VLFNAPEPGEAMLAQNEPEANSLG